MLETGSCEAVLMNHFERIWAFITSWEGQLLFMVAATVRAIFYYLLRNPMPEARELAYVMAATGFFALWIAVTASYSPVSMRRLVTVCIDRGPKVADDGQTQRPAIVSKHAR